MADSTADQRALLDEMDRFMRSHVRNGEQRTADVLARAIGEINRLEQCHREGWRYAKEIEDEYRKRTGHGFGDDAQSPTKPAERT